MTQCHMSNYSCWPTFFTEWGYLCLCQDRYPVNTLIRLIFWQIISNIFQQRVKLVFHLNLTYFRRNFEYSRWPIRYFAKCRYVISRMALLVNAYTSRSVCSFIVKWASILVTSCQQDPFGSKAYEYWVPLDYPKWGDHSEWSELTLKQ